MLKFKYTKVAGRRMRRLRPEMVPGLLRAMQKRPTWERVVISPDAKPRPDGEGQYPILSLGWYPGFGYEAHCLELTPKSHFVVTSTILSKPEVYVEFGGQGQELWPRELFVPFAMAERAVLRLLQAGERDRSFSWVAIDAFPRRSVKARSRITRPRNRGSSDA